ncbi:hypothetical protein TanjilG_14350 [Lupinus angustifolius]|uniref:RRM domain-containing protein n=1 Tax=Lupinus angustifolius TaxID=3871 RepID=A0A1J7IC34_LUPAN|nr:hypothetical protein TanjilG_14350 [Lupinus angustifolius]
MRVARPHANNNAFERPRPHANNFVVDRPRPYHLNFEGRSKDNLSTIYITNFPDDFRTSDLWHFFLKWGRVRDVYIPFKRNSFGQRFERNRDRSCGRKMTQRTVWVNSTQNVRDGRSFADAVRGEYRVRRLKHRCGGDQEGREGILDEINVECGPRCIGKRMNVVEDSQGDDTLNGNYCEACFLSHGHDSRANLCGGIFNAFMESDTKNHGPSHDLPLNLISPECGLDVGPETNYNLHDSPHPMDNSLDSYAPILVEPKTPGLGTAAEINGPGMDEDQAAGGFLDVQKKEKSSSENFQETEK